MSLIRSERVKALDTAIKLNFNEGLKTLVDETHTEFTMEIQSDSSSNTYEWMSEMPIAQEWKGARKLKNVAMRTYEVDNKDWETSIEVHENDVMDNKLAGKMVSAKNLGKRIKEVKPRQAYLALKKGHETLCYDGQFFFDTDHPIFEHEDGTGSSTPYSNMDAGDHPAWFLLCGSDPIIKPIIWQNRSEPRFLTNGNENSEAYFMEKKIKYGADRRGASGYGYWQMAHRSQKELTEENFDEVYDKMCSQKGDGGIELGIVPNLLVVPPRLRKKALKIVEAIQNEGSTNVNRGIVKVIVSPYLA